MSTESYFFLALWCVAGLLTFLSVFRRDRDYRFGRSPVVWISLLAMVLFLTVLWVRQSFRDEGARMVARIEAAEGDDGQIRSAVADDSKMNRMVLEAQLKRLGSPDVAAAPDGREALAVLRAPGAAPFDLVLTDVWMPDLGGEGLLREIRADPALRGLRVVAVTADVEFRAKVAEAGFDGMLLKPVTIAALAEILPGGFKHG